MTVRYYPEVEQGSDEWHQLKCGILSGSTMKQIITPGTLKFAQNPVSRALLNELLAERITGFSEHSDFVSDAMQRGHEDEITAREIYSEKIGPVKQMGFVTNDEWGFTIGFSPDGLTDAEWLDGREISPGGFIGFERNWDEINGGFVEIKSRHPKFQVPTIIEDAVPSDYTIQVQTGFAVTKLSKCDFISFCGGLPMLPIRVEPIPLMIGAIVEAAKAFERTLQERLAAYWERVRTNKRLIPTVRRIPLEEGIYI